MPRAQHAPFAGAFTRAAIFGAVLAAPACWTGDTAATTTASPDPSPAPGTIEGLLTSSDTGDAMPNHRVTLRSDGVADRFATTDSAGRYRFTKVPPGNYVIVFLDAVVANPVAQVQPICRAHHGALDPPFVKRRRAYSRNS